jgi:hypothetical protein
VVAPLPPALKPFSALGGEWSKSPCLRISIRSAGPADGKGANDCLAALVHMYMLDPHELRAAVPQAAPGLYLDGIGTLKSGRRGPHRGNTSSGAVRAGNSPQHGLYGSDAR